MIYGLLFVSLATMYPAEDLMGLAEQKISALLRGQIDCAQRAASSAASSCLSPSSKYARSCKRYACPTVFPGHLQISNASLACRTVSIPCGGLTLDSHEIGTLMLEGPESHSPPPSRMLGHG